jgi:hypothetical protein
MVAPVEDARNLIAPAAASSLSNRLARVELMPSLLPSARSLVRRTPFALGYRPVAQRHPNCQAQPTARFNAEHGQEHEQLVDPVGVDA